MRLFRIFNRAALPPIATWIHPVTEWSRDHQMAVESSSALTVCTRAWKEYLEQRVGYDVPVTVVPHGVDTQFFQRRNVPPKRFGIPAGRLVLGFVGNKGSDSDGGRKGSDVFLRVVRDAAALVPNLHVVLGGPGWEQELQSLWASGVSASATGRLGKSDLPLLYSALDLYLLTSRVEGGPCTVLEAMACETAVVSTRVGTVPEIITDGVNGMSTEVDDRDALLAAIVELAQSPEKRLRLAKAGREAVSARSWDAVLSPLEGVYDALVRQRRHAGMPLPGPAWMNDPQHLFRASCAADALANVIPRVRRGAISAAQGIGQLRQLLQQQSFTDVTLGAAMFAGVTFRSSGPSPHRASADRKDVSPHATPWRSRLLIALLATGAVVAGWTLHNRVVKVRAARVEHAVPPLPYFPPGAPWTEDISHAPLDPRSSATISWLSDAGGWGHGRMQIDFGIRVLQASPNTPEVPFHPGADWMDADSDRIAAIPLPAGGGIEGQPNYECNIEQDDCHLIVVDRGHGKLYEAYQANYTASVLRANFLAVWDLTRVYPPSGRGEQCTSADAAGLPIAPLLFTADELATGSINHALRFILPNARISAGVFVHPATHAGAPRGPALAPPMGARFRLKASYDLSRLTPAAQVVARAMQKYGMFLADGGNVALTAQSDADTQTQYADVSFGPHDLQELKVTDFEIVEEGRPIRLTDDCERNH